MVVRPTLGTERAIVSNASSLAFSTVQRCSIHVVNPSIRNIRETNARIHSVYLMRFQTEKVNNG